MDECFVETETYKKTKKQTLKDWPKASEDIKEAEKLVRNNPKIGIACTGYGEVDVRKLKKKMKSYKFGKRYGLRFFYQYVPPYIIPILIFKKYEDNEPPVKAKVNEKMKEIDEEINGSREE